MCARVGGANTIPFMAAHFAKQNTKFGGGGKRGRAKIPSPQPPSFLPARAFRFCARSAQSFGVLLKKSSNINQKRPPNCTLCEIVRGCLGASRLGIVFFRNFKGIFEIQNQSAVGNAEVPVRQHRENEVFRANLFSFAFSERLSVFFFDCPKTNFKTIWTT